MARLQDLDRIYSSCGFPAEKLQFWGRSALYQSKTLAISAGVIVTIVGQRLRINYILRCCVYPLFFNIFFLPRQLPRLPQWMLHLWDITERHMMLFIRYSNMFIAV